MIIKYHSEARKELFKTAEYYEEQVVGLGDEFLFEVEKVLDVIRQYPLSGTEITSKMNLRRKSDYWKHRT